jgi:hypothetical protein
MWMSFNNVSCIISETRMILEKGYFMKITDTQQMNNQIFSKGEIQISPQHLQMLNMQQPTLFKPKARSNISMSGYKIFLTGYADYVIKNEVDNYASYSLEVYINQLRSNPRSVQSNLIVKNTVATRKVSSGKYYLWYKIISGQIVVFNVELQDQFQNARDRLEKPGLYN